MDNFWKIEFMANKKLMIGFLDAAKREITLLLNFDINQFKFHFQILQWN